MIAKLHKNPDGRIILALCDDSLIGKKISDGELQLDMACDFYKGEEKSEDEIKKLISLANVINAVGEKTIKFLKDINLIDDRRIIKIAGIPHAEIVIAREE